MNDFPRKAGMTMARSGRFIAVVWLGLGYAAIAAPAQELKDTRSWIEIRAKTREERTTIANCGIAPEVSGEGLVSAIVGPREMQCVREAGFAIVEERPLTEMGPMDFPEEDGVYHNFQEMSARIVTMVSSHPDLASAGSIGTSHQGRPIPVLRLTASPERVDQPGLLFIGSHHAREHLSTEVPLLIAQRLVDNRNHPEVNALLAGRDLYFMPNVNPDGSEYDLEGDRYHYYRKNMRDNGNGAVGVDLNRNYGWGWGGSGASASPGSDTYRGPSAFSEPESQAVRDFLRAHPNITVAVSYHSSGDLILYPWSDVYEPIPDQRALGAFKAMGAEMARLTGYRSMQSSDLYASSGDTCDWAWGELKVFCFTFELPGGGFYPGPAIIGPTVDENLQAALYLMSVADDPYRAGTAGALTASENGAGSAEDLGLARARLDTLPKKPDFDGKAK